MSDSRHTPQDNKLTPGYLEVLVISLIIVGVAFWTYDRYFAQKIKIVDMSGYFRQQKALMAAGELTEADFRTSLNKLDAYISQDAELHKNQVYILKEVVLKNGDEFLIR
ncbi:hypothetical protein [Desulfogranum marinum]|uniref:hypothetical protein n=1 Tax=Desulfogranum marinum TaxID=453220 RepID=UPI0019654EF0|nr:hypothetical protein [Desulfogranum marinum]MBM9514853.1 hypothetical protein [Desulfogranum marinum]